MIFLYGAEAEKGLCFRPFFFDIIVQRLILHAFKTVAGCFAGAESYDDTFVRRPDFSTSDFLLQSIDAVGVDICLLYTSDAADEL